MSQRLGEACPAELLDAGERLCTDELRSVQLDRLQDTVRRSVRERAALPRRAGRRRVRAGRPEGPRGPEPVAVHDQGGPAARTTRSACSPYRASRWCGCTPRPVRRARPTVVGYTRADIDTWADLMARSIRAAGGRAGRCLPRRVRVRAVHRRTRRALRRRTARLHRRTGVRRDDRAPGRADPATSAPGSSWSRRRTSSPSLDEMVARGIDPRGHRVADRDLRRRTVDRADARRGRDPDRDARGRHLRAVRGDGPGCRAGVRRDQGRAAHLGGPLLPRGDRPGHRRGAAGRRAR